MEDGVAMDSSTTRAYPARASSGPSPDPGVSRCAVISSTRRSISTRTSSALDP